MTIKIKPYTEALGAEILNINLGRKLSDKNLSLIKDAINKYHVLFFRDQDITSNQFINFGKNFGSLEIHPLIPTLPGHPEIIEMKSLETGPAPMARNSEVWHSDMSYTKVPPYAGILKAMNIPESGGNTMFLNAALAYEALSGSMKKFLSKLKAVHSIVKTMNNDELLDSNSLKRFIMMNEKLPPIEHPIIRTHPETGKKLIFVNEIFTSHITGLNSNESDAILQLLYRHIHNPNFQCRFIWQQNSIAFWDNQITQHYAVADYSSLRTMHRLTVDGTHKPR
ncbi:MAG: TauD/TfdA family dioxygenase [Gammaproteobacteria bacterium]|nr:TauD/TfdA family dioxygenase [Gammaproteobacteria bacterium]|tara:strand:+ start:1280 stop:2122 length:843 start_codon:yes stop_codon:yes gene_type:complete